MTFIRDFSLLRCTHYLMIWLLLCFSPTLLSSPLTYTPLNTYLSQHPSQQAISEHFSLRVRAAAQGISVEQQRPVRIFVIYPGKQISDYWRRSIASFTARLDELNIQYELKTHYTRPAMAQEQQERLLNRATRYRADYIIFTLDTHKHSEFIERLLKVGISKIILQNITTPVAQWQANPPFLYVGFDHEAGSRKLGQYFKQKTQNSGDYGVVYWSPGLISEARGESFINELKQSSALNLAQSYYTQASRQSAYRSTLAILKRNPQVKFIYACATDVALGVLDALKETGLKDKIMVNGWGGGEQELAAIEQGELDVTVMRMNDDNGVAMAEAIKLDIQGLASQVPQVYSGDFAIITKQTPASRLEQLKAIAFRYSGIPTSNQSLRQSQSKHQAATRQSSNNQRSQ
ncbi:substrate-binding domain-containing protein [Motilimonas eburnea]|uniref:substrate-binding domain-containing protein n=1 Tax=Motilimonas eburnea TaxID=1737488 RepID=UPI001E37A130|nr:substrate-binding domain-containing protein [Motilimonas eburnea]MCE2573100.1 substrate-binding domain-containing protein [Motilimonas eburnea]